MQILWRIFAVHNERITIKQLKMKEELRVRVSEELKRELEKEAKELNLGLSSYVRMKLSTKN